MSLSPSRGKHCTRSSQSHRSSRSPSHGKDRGRNSRWSRIDDCDDDDDDDDDEEEPEKQSSNSNNGETTDEEGKEEEEEEKGEQEAEKRSSDEEEFDYEEDIEEEEDPAEKKQRDVTVISDESDDEVCGFILSVALVVCGCSTVCPRYNAVFEVHDIELRYSRGALYSMCYSVCRQGATNQHKKGKGKFIPRQYVKGKP